MREQIITFGIGLTSGLLSGAFGIGGGIITTPAIRLILGAPALVAVGTPLPVIFPSALTGAATYARSGLVDIRTGVACGITGSLAAIAGAWATHFVGGNVVLIATAALILYTAADMILQVARPPKQRPELEAAEEADAAEAIRQLGSVAGSTAGAEEALTGGVASGSSTERVEGVRASETGSDRGSRAYGTEAAGPMPRSVRAQPGSVGASAQEPAFARLALIGIAAGFYSGFLGLGGGFVLVPMLTRWLGFPIKRAIATSLLTITILAVPGTAMHAMLGHIDWGIALLLAVGVVPGAFIGSRVTLGSADRTVRIAFALLLLAVGAWLGIATLTGGGA